VAVTGTIGRVIRLIDPPAKLVCDSHVTVVRCLGINPEYVRTWLRSDHVYALIEDRAAGSTNQVELTSQLAANQIIPLPPLAEQHRIVAKVDKLMAMCDQLDKARSEREMTRDRLTTASLARLDAPDPSPETFRRDALFALDMLPSIAVRDGHIEQLRKTILNLALRGKLVAQDQREQPIEIPVGKVGLLEGAGSSETLMPYLVPITWKWCEFHQVAEFENGDRSKNYPNRSEYVEKGVAWINTGHIERDGSLALGRMNYITPAKFRTLRGGKIRPGDLVYCLRGATFGKTAFVEPFAEGAIASSLMIVRPKPLVLGRFVYYYLISPFGRTQLLRFDNGTAQPNLSAGNVRKYFIALPPLTEQKRIVAKVDELMSLCDRLEAGLTASEEARDCLLDALLHEALEPASAPLEAAA
jgi:type I restriction enzyme S subunit